MTIGNFIALNAFNAPCAPRVPNAGLCTGTAR